MLEILGTIVLWIGRIILFVVGGAIAIVVGVVLFGIFGWLLAIVLIIAGVSMGMPSMVIGGIVCGIVWVIVAPFVFSQF